MGAITGILHAELEIHVEPHEGWGDSDTVEIETLCKNVALHFNEQLRHEYKISGKIKIVYNHNFPVLFGVSDPGYDYKIGLSSGENHWGAIAYEFAHEFCHILITKPENDWFEESIASMASIWVIQEMSKTWEYRAPYDKWIDYRHFLREYASNLRHRKSVQFSGTGEEWLTKYESIIRVSDLDDFNYDLASGLSYKFLNIFEKYPESWNAIAQLHNSKSTMKNYVKYWYKNVDFQDKKIVEIIAKEMNISLEEINTAYTIISFFNDNTNSITPINAVHEWDGWTKGVWEKFSDDEITPKPNGYIEFDEINNMSHWLYSHASSLMKYNISDKQYTSFGSYFLMPNPGCDAGASMEFSAFADNIEIFSTKLFFDDYGTYIEFNLPLNTNILTISVNDLGVNLCDHFVLGEPKLYTDSNSSPNITTLTNKEFNADVNKDGSVDLTDVKMVRKAINAKVFYDADINGDDVINELDLLIVKAKAHEAIAAAAPSLNRRNKLTTWGELKRKN